MEAFFTANNCKKKGQARSIAKVSLGRLCERIARGYCQRLGWRILRANWRFAGGEIDLLAEDRSGNWIVVEVRGRESSEFAPSRFLAPAKKYRLERMAMLLAARHQRCVRLYFVEVIGKRPRSAILRWGSWVLARWCAPGFQIRTWALD